MFYEIHSPTKIEKETIVTYWANLLYVRNFSKLYSYFIYGKLKIFEELINTIIWVKYQSSMYRSSIESYPIFT